MPNPPDHRLVQERTVSPGGVELLRIRPCSETLPFRTAEWTLLALRQLGRALTLEVGSARHPLPALADTGTLLPPAAPVRLEVPDGDATIDLVLFPGATCIALRTLAVEFRPAGAPWFDPQVHAWIDALWEAGPDDGLVASLARWVSRKTDHATAVPTDDHPLPPGRARWVRAELANRWNRPLDLATLAEPCGLAPEALSRAFRSVFGQPPSRYLTVLRVERAAQRFHGRAPVDLHGIALQSGFYDQSHMNRQFKRILGLTPGEYRERT